MNIVSRQPPHWITLLLVFMLGLSACGVQPSPLISGDKVLVVASILPLADFAWQVGGDRVQVETLVPPGATPHTYELTPAQLKAISRARLLVLNGVGLEYWADEIVSAANNPDLVIVNTSEGLTIIASDEYGTGGNPHVWLSPLNALHQVEMIRDALIQVDPTGRDEYLTNADRYIGELQSLDREIREAVSTFSSREFIAFHVAWVYFARDYGLKQAAVIEATPGKEPSPAEIAEIFNTARAIGAKAIFAEPQFSSKAAEVIAEESGAQVLFLNPLGQPPDYRYIDLMRYNLSEIGKALK
ncbi:MAG: zinc ABC transporter substrate-binding protein [Anaerolineales bacterium]